MQPRFVFSYSVAEWGGRRRLFELGGPELLEQLGQLPNFLPVKSILVMRFFIYYFPRMTVRDSQKNASLQFLL